MTSRGMSELPPEAAVRNRALSPAPATLHPGQNATSLARSVPLSGVSGSEHPALPCVTPAPTDAACVGHSVAGSDAQRHNAMRFINFQL